MGNVEVIIEACVSLFVFFYIAPEITVKKLAYSRYSSYIKVN